MATYTDEYITQEEAQALRDKIISGKGLLEQMVGIAGDAKDKAGLDAEDRTVIHVVYEATSALLKMANARVVETQISSVYGDGKPIARLSTIERDRVISNINKFAQICGEPPKEGVIPIPGLNTLTEAFLAEIQSGKEVTLAAYAGR